MKNLCTPIILAKMQEAKILQPSQSSCLINDKQAIIIFNFNIYRGISSVILISDVLNVLHRAGSEDKYYAVLNAQELRIVCVIRWNGGGLRWIGGLRCDDGLIWKLCEFLFNCTLFPSPSQTTDCLILEQGDTSPGLSFLSLL